MIDLNGASKSAPISSGRSQTPDFDAMSKQQRSDDVAQRIVDQIKLRPVEALREIGNDTCIAQFVARDGVFTPRPMFGVIRKLFLAAEKALDPGGSGNVSLSTKHFLDKLRNFEKDFVACAVVIANKPGRSLAQGDLALVAHDVLRLLADSAAALKKWNRCDEKLSNRYSNFFEKLAKFHLTYGAKSSFVESAKRSVAGAKIKNPNFDRRWAGVHSGSDKSIGIKVGAGYDACGVDLSGSVYGGVAETIDITVDDDDDTLCLALDYVEMGASLDAKFSAYELAHSGAHAGAHAGAHVAGKMRFGQGTLTDASNVQTLMEVEAIRRPNKLKFPGHRSSHPSTRAIVERWATYRYRAGNAALSNAFRPDECPSYYLDSGKLYDYSACQATLHSLADDLGNSSDCDLLRDFIDAFKSAYPEEDYRVVNALAMSLVSGMTNGDSSKEKSDALTAWSGVGTFGAGGGLAVGDLGGSASFGAGYQYKSKAFAFEKLLDSHEILNPVNAGSLERSTAMIDEARMLLTSENSQHMFCLIDRIVNQKSLEEKDTFHSFAVLEASIRELEKEHQKFLVLQKECFMKEESSRAFKEINRLYFDGYFDMEGHTRHPRFKMDFLARSHDAFSSTLGVICNRLTALREKAIDELNEGGGDLSRFDDVAKNVDDAYDALAKKFKSPQSSIPREDRLRCAFFQLPTRLTQKGHTVNASFELSLDLPEIPVGGGFKMSDFVQYLHPGVKLSLGVERQEVREHVNPLRIGTFLTLTCDFNAALPYAELIDKAVEKMADAVAKASGEVCEMVGPEQLAFKGEIRRQLTIGNVFESLAHVAGDNMTRRVVLKMRKPIPPGGVASTGNFEGDWSAQYTRVDASSNTKIGLSTPNFFSYVGIPAKLQLVAASNQSAGAPTSEAMGDDVAYHALQFTDGNAWDEKTRTINFERLSDFYKNGVVHGNKEINKDGKYVAMQLFDDATCILEVLKDYVDYRNGEGAGSDYALMDTPHIQLACARYRETIRSAPGQSTGKALSECAKSNLDPYELIELPTLREIADLKKTLATKTPLDKMDIFLGTDAGKKAMTAYFQLMKAVNLDKVAYKQSVGFKPRLRPNALLT